MRRPKKIILRYLYIKKNIVRGNYIKRGRKNYYIRKYYLVSPFCVLVHNK